MLARWVFEPECFICHYPALMGYHPACVLRSAKVNVPGDKSVVCEHCPFRSDRPNWMDKGRLLLNRLRVGLLFELREGRKARPCGGAAICIVGGQPGLVMSPAELDEVRPVKDATEAWEAYNAG